MRGKKTDLRPILNIISAIILLVGLGSAFLIYRTAENVPAGVLGYEQGDGGAYPVMPDDSKKYLRDLELYGGKANVLMDQFRRWFIGLWHGKSLAYTIACITIFISLGTFYVANHWPPVLESGTGNEDHQDKT
jgi:hypothetical protein